MDDKPRRQRRQLRNFLIDRKVQLRFTVIMVVLTSMLTAALGTFWYGEMRRASGVIRVNAMATLGDLATSQLTAELASQDRQRLLVLVGFSVLLAILIAGYGIVMTHKIAGPLFKIARHLGDIEANHLQQIFELRKGDQLQEFFAAFKHMHTALRGRVERDLTVLDRVIAEVEGGGDLKAQLGELKALREEKGDSLRGPSATT
jgi:methyl-accepting chemotaxis protein